MATFFLTFLINDREKRKREPLPSKTRERREGIFIERERKRAREVKRGRWRERERGRGREEVKREGGDKEKLEREKGNIETLKINIENQTTPDNTATS